MKYQTLDLLDNTIKQQYKKLDKLDDLRLVSVSILSELEEYKEITDYFNLIFEMCFFTNNKPILLNRLKKPFKLNLKVF